MNPENQLEELISLQERMTKGKVSEDDFIVAFESLIKLIKDIKEDLEEKSGEDKRELKDTISNLEETIGQIESRLLRNDSQIKDSFKEELNTLTQQIYKEVNSIKELIPGETDFSEVNARISEVEAKIPQIPDEITAEQVKNKLETLKGDNRLDKSAIKGLQEELEEIRKIKVSSGRGGVSKDLIYTQDIGDQFNGVDKTINIQPVFTIIAVMLDSHPYGSLVEGLHYNYTMTTITFTDEIELLQLGVGQKCKIIATRI